MKWGPTHSWMIMNGHEYCVCSAAMWPQGGELGPLQFPLLISNNSPQDLWKLDFWHLHMTEQWHNWTKPFQGFRQNWNWWDQMLYVSQLDVWVYVYVYMCVFFSIHLCHKIVFQHCIGDSYSKYNVMLLKCLWADWSHRKLCWLKHCLWINGELYSSVHFSPLIGCRLTPASDTQAFRQSSHKSSPQKTQIKDLTPKDTKLNCPVQ